MLPAQCCDINNNTIAIILCPCSLTIQIWLCYQTGWMLGKPLSHCHWRLSSHDREMLAPLPSREGLDHLTMYQLLERPYVMNRSHQASSDTVCLSQRQLDWA